MSPLTDNNWDIIIVSWQNVVYLKKAIGSLRMHSKNIHNIIIYFNGTTEEEAERIVTHEIPSSHKWGPILYLSNPVNIGLCDAANNASLLGTSDFIYLMDDDMYVLPNWDRELHNFRMAYGFEDDTYLCSVMVEPNSTSSHSIEGDYGHHPQRFREVALLHDFEDGLFKDVIKPIVNTYMPVLFSRKMWEQIGGYSIEFSPGIGSDDDLAKKAWDFGCHNPVGVPDSLVYHFQSATTARITNYAEHAINRDKVFKELYGMTLNEFHKEIKRGKPWVLNLT